MAEPLNIFAKSTATCVFGILILAGCSPDTNNVVRATIEYIQRNPNVEPDFISASPLGDECLDVNQDAVWEVGDTARSLQDHLTRSIQLTIDENVVLDAERSVKSVHLAGSHIYNDNGEIVGSTGGPITVCAPRAGLESGLHLAKLEFNSTSGKPYTFSWVFDVN